MKSPTLEEILASVDSLPSLPGIVNELIQAQGREDVSVDDLVHCIAQDQALTARVLRVANSPFYGMQHKVASIHDAVVVLGLRAVSNLVLAASMTGYFTPPPGYGFDPRGFWRHSFGTALAARILAQHCRMDPETGFTAGLLHDIGRLMLMTHHAEGYAQVVTTWEEGEAGLWNVERGLLGFDHAQAGELLARRWRFPEAIAQAVARHHTPAEGQARTFADVIHLADVLAHALELGGDGLDRVYPIDAGVWRRLGLDGPALDTLLPEIGRAHAGCDALFTA